MLGFKHVPNPLKQTQRAAQHVPALVPLLGGLLALQETRPSHPNRDVWGGRHNRDLAGWEQCCLCGESSLGDQDLVQMAPGWMRVGSVDWLEGVPTVRAGQAGLMG